MKQASPLPLQTSSSSLRWLILGVATFAQASSTLVTYGVGPLAAVWQNHFHLNASQAGLLVSAVQVGPLLSMLWIGHALDRWGERWLVSLGSVLLGITFMWTALTDQYAAWLLLLGLAGIWYGTAQPGGSKVILKWFSPGERGLAMGIRQAGIPVGGAAGAVLLPSLSVQVGWQAAVWVMATIAVIGGVLFWSVYRDPSGFSSAPAAKEPFRRKMAKILRNKEAMPVLFAGVVLVSLQMVIVGHLMFYFISEAKTGLVQAGQLLSAALLAGMAGRIVLASLSDRWWRGNRMIPLHLSIWASVLGILLLLMVPPGTVIAFLLCSWLGFFGIGWFSSWLLAVAESAPSGSEGLMVSYALTLNQAAIILAPALFGVITDAASPMLAWSGLAVLLGGSGVGLLVYSVRSENRAGESQGSGSG